VSSFAECGQGSLRGYPPYPARSPSSRAFTDAWVRSETPSFLMMRCT
jgi:hypothetical protein